MSNKIDKVVVLMSTYNGQKYIEQQIESIEQQQDVYIDLVIRDDGSTDQTVAIINNLTKKYDNIILINGGNLGYVKSFSSLVRYAYEQYADDCMFAFVDQDDIWKEAKLKIACENIASCDQRKPLLFCSNSMLIDSYCKEVCEFRPYAPTFKKGTVLYYGTVQGCSMVFNRKAVELYNSCPPVSCIHDRWMVLICTYLGEVYYSNVPLFYYRVHGENAVGSSINRSLVHRLNGKLKRFRFNKTELTRIEVSEFLKAFNKSLNDYDKSIITTYLTYKTSLKSKLKMIFSKDYGPRYNTFSRKLEFIIDLLFNRL